MAGTLDNYSTILCPLLAASPGARRPHGPIRICRLSLKHSTGDSPPKDGRYDPQQPSTAGLAARPSVLNGKREAGQNNWIWIQPNRLALGAGDRRSKPKEFR
jgi:hypothetical protein